MNAKAGFSGRLVLIVALALAAVAAGAATRIIQDQCGPFTDVSPQFCPYVLEAYYTGITAGTSATTFSPDVPITRGQAAVFVTKGLNQAVARNRRAALGQWFTTAPLWGLGLGTTNVGAAPALPQSDGADIWVPNFVDGTVSRVRASDGRLLETWIGATNAYASLVAAGRIFITQDTGATGTAGSLYMIDPTAPAGIVTTVATNLGTAPVGIAFDGSRIWTANFAGTGPAPGSVSIITPGQGTWSVSTISTGFQNPTGIIFDGANIWVTDYGDGYLKKLDASGSILSSIYLGGGPEYPAFDGANIWVPQLENGTVSVVSASTGTVLATLSGNGLAQPWQAAFDGQRVLVTNTNADTVSLFTAADLVPIGHFNAPGGPYGVCSDGINFWVTLLNANTLGRY